MGYKEIITDAISNRLCLDVRYNNRLRRVEPYVLGKASDGKLLLLCYQISGGSESGQSAGWKMLSLAQLQAIEITPARFVGGRLAYGQKTKAMQTILARLP